MGVAAHRIETISYGEERPFLTGHSEEAWARNRRAHFVLGNSTVSDLDVVRGTEHP